MYKGIIIVVWAMLFISLNISRVEAGVIFENGLTWEQVKRKAVIENKYIFIDCFATWCGPCKKMDKDVYPDSKVGQAVNKNFIAIKLQMDSTANDGVDVKKWYEVAREFSYKYKIKGYPAYLFFSSDGDLVYQDFGYKNVDDFISLIQDASDPSLRDENIFDAYKQGDRSANVLLKAAKRAKKNGNMGLADSISFEYKKMYLDVLSDGDYFLASNLHFIFYDFPNLAFKEGSKGRLFHYIWHHPESIDSIFYKGFSENYIKAIITNEELVEKLFISNKVTANEPKWNSLKTSISGKYNALYAKKVIDEFMPVFYLRSANWLKWAKLFEGKFQSVKLKKDGNHLGSFADDWHLNEKAWTVFLGCSDNRIIRKALRWVDLAIQIKGEEKGLESYYDTKANLLYKLGKKRKAISLEKQALKLSYFFAQKQGKTKSLSTENYEKTLKKMEDNHPTWNLK